MNEIDTPYWFGLKFTDLCCVHWLAPSSRAISSASGSSRATSSLEGIEAESECTADNTATRPDAA